MKKNRRISTGATVAVILLMILTSFPLYVMLVGAFKENIALISIPMDLSLKNLTLKNIIAVFQKSDIARWMKNSLVLSLTVACVTALIGLTAGYAFARIKFRGKKMFFTLVMATMMMPKQVLLIPNFLVANKLGLVNTMLGLILTSITPASAVFLARQFISTLPGELFEAAEIDGCSEPGKFFRIALPLALPAGATSAIFSFFGTFNDYVWQLIMISDPDLKTLPIGISSLSSLYLNNKTIQLAGALVASVPLIAIFLMAQKFFVKGSTAGAVKG